MVGLGLQGSRVSGSLRDHSEERLRILGFWVFGCRGWRFVLGSNDCIFKAYVSDCCGNGGCYFRALGEGGGSRLRAWDQKGPPWFRVGLGFRDSKPPHYIGGITSWSTELQYRGLSHYLSYLGGSLLNYSTRSPKTLF